MRPSPHPTAERLPDGGEGARAVRGGRGADQARPRSLRRGVQQAEGPRQGDLQVRSRLAPRQQAPRQTVSRFTLKMSRFPLQAENNTFHIRYTHFDV